MADEFPSREEALATIRGARRRLDRLIADLSDAQVEAPATLGGGEWSIKNLLGHLASWEERALPWLNSDEATDSTSYPPTDAFNAAEIERKAGWSLAAVRDHAEQVHRRLIDSIEHLSDDAWLAKVQVPGREVAPRGLVVGSILAGNEHGLFAHDLAHLDDVEAYVRAVGGGSGSSPAR